MRFDEASLANLANDLLQGVHPERLLKTLESLTSDHECPPEIAPFCPFFRALRYSCYGPAHLIKSLLVPHNLITAFLLADANAFQQFLSSCNVSDEQTALWALLGAYLDVRLSTRWSNEDAAALRTVLVQSDLPSEDIRWAAQVMLGDLQHMHQLAPSFLHLLAATMIWSPSKSSAYTVEWVRKNWTQSLGLVDILVIQAIKQDWQSLVEKLAEADDWVTVHTLIALDAFGLLRMVKSGQEFFSEVSAKYATELVREGHVHEGLVYLRDTGAISEKLLHEIAVIADSGTIIQVPERWEMPIKMHVLRLRIDAGQLSRALDWVAGYDLPANSLARGFLTAFNRLKSTVGASQPEDFEVFTPLEDFIAEDPHLAFVKKFHHFLSCSLNPKMHRSALEGLVELLELIPTTTLYEALPDILAGLERVWMLDPFRVRQAVQSLPEPPGPRSLYMMYGSDEGRCIPAVLPSEDYTSWVKQYHKMFEFTKAMPSNFEGVGISPTGAGEGDSKGGDRDWGWLGWFAASLLGTGV